MGNQHQPKSAAARPPIMHPVVSEDDLRDPSAHQSKARLPGAILSLQRTIGNQAVQRLLAEEKLASGGRNSQTPSSDSVSLTTMPDRIQRHTDPAIIPIKRAAVSDAIQREDERSHKQSDIWYEVISTQDIQINQTKTHWGDTWGEDDSSFSCSGTWDPPRMDDGIGQIGAQLMILDIRDSTLRSAKTHVPTLDVQFRFQQRAPHESLVLTPSAMNYIPDGGGSIQVTAYYVYGGIHEDKWGQQWATHSVMLNFVYSSNAARQSGSDVKLGSIGDANSTSVTDAAVSFSREIRFKSSAESLVNIEE